MGNYRQNAPPASIQQGRRGTHSGACPIPIPRQGSKQACILQPSYNPSAHAHASGPPPTLTMMSASARTMLRAWPCRRRERSVVPAHSDRPEFVLACTCSHPFLQDSTQQAGCARPAPGWNPTARTWPELIGLRELQAGPRVPLDYGPVAPATLRAQKGSTVSPCKLLPSRQETATACSKDVRRLKLFAGRCKAAPQASMPCPKQAA